MLDAFRTNGSSPPARRYRLKLATWTIVREPGQPSPRKLEVLIHNHPGGDPAPSREDIRLTRQLAEAGRLLDVPVHDRLIVSNGTTAYVSFAERGLL